jgi:large subunit ribosomal protein L30
MVATEATPSAEVEPVVPVDRSTDQPAGAEHSAQGRSLKVTQVKSGIGTKPKHRGTLRALGLRGIGQSNTLPDRPEIRGMIARVPHLVSVEEVQ